MATKKTKSSLDALFDDNDIENAEGLTTVRLSSVEPNKAQPRKDFDSESLAQLADSINKHGILQPLIVRSLPSGGYQIIAGERRWRAAKMAGLSEVPVVVRDDLKDEQIMQVALIENLQRENLNPLEEALGYKELMDNYHMTQEELSQAIGKARSTIANSVSLLSLPNGVKKLLESGELSAGHCKALKAISDPALMTELANKAAQGELSVRQVEQIAKREAKRLEEASRTREIKPRATYYTEVEVSLAEQLGTKVKISEGKRGSTLQICFEDEEQLKGILKHFIQD